MASTPERAAAARECATHLATREGWPELLREARKKVEGLGALGGRVPVPKGSPMVRAAHDLGIKVAGGIALVKLSAVLETTRFRTSLLDVLEASGGPLQFRHALRLREEERWARQFASLLREAETCAGTAVARAATRRWLELDAARLRARCRRGGQATVDSIALVARVATYLQHAERTEPLAVVSNKFTGDPKALLAVHAAGRLLLRALSVIVHGVVGSGGETAHDRAVLYSAVGLRGDDISSDVTVSGLLGEHPLVRALRVGGHAMTIPLVTLRDLGALRAWRDVVFVVENRTVFGPLQDALRAIPPDCRPTLVCSSGQPTLAVHRLLRTLVDAGARVQYSGDFDVPGLRIAAGMRVALGDAVSFWRMAPEDYLFGLEHRPAYRPAKALGPSTGLDALLPSFPSLIPTMRARDSVVYHESLTEAMITDLLAFVQPA